MVIKCCFRCRRPSRLTPRTRCLCAADYVYDIPVGADIASLPGSAILTPRPGRYVWNIRITQAAVTFRVRSNLRRYKHCSHPCRDCEDCVLRALFAAQGSQQLHTTTHTSMRSVAQAAAVLFRYFKQQQATLTRLRLLPMPCPLDSIPADDRRPGPGHCIYSPCLHKRRHQAATDVWAHHQAARR